MNEIPTAAIDADELRLAQLACSRLAKLVQGTLSIGLPALLTGMPNLRNFLENQFRLMSAFGLVMHSISGKMGSSRAIGGMRDRSAQVLTDLEDLQRRLLAFIDSTDHSLAALEPTRASICNLCDSIGEYGQFALLDGALIANVKKVSLQVFDALPTLNPPQATPAR